MTPPTQTPTPAPSLELLRAAIEAVDHDGGVCLESAHLLAAHGPETGLETNLEIAARVLLAHVRAVHAEVAANAQNQETNTGCQQHDIEGESKREAFTEAAALLLPEGAS